MSRQEHLIPLLDLNDEDITIVMTTHDPNLMELGDEVFELSDGIVI